MKACRRQRTCVARRIRAFVYDAAQREERVRLRKLAWQRKELLAQLADVDQKILAERERISHLPTGIRRAIEAETDREPMHPMWSPT